LQIKQKSRKWKGEVNINGEIALSNSKYAIEALCRLPKMVHLPGKIGGEVVECPLHFWHYNIYEQVSC